MKKGTWYSRNRERVLERQRAYASKPEVKERQRAYNAKYFSKPEVKERQRAYNAKYFSKPEVKERKRAYNAKYFSKPEVKERQRAYASKPEVKERKRAYHRDQEKIAQRLELAADGIEAIMKEVRAGRRYIDIADDWLIAESDVSDIAIANGVRRKVRKELQFEVRA